MGVCGVDGCACMYKSLGWYIKHLKLMLICTSVCHPPCSTAGTAMGDLQDGGGTRSRSVLSNPIDVVTNHKNLEYFATLKVLMCNQVHWSEYLSTFNLVICFCPVHLGAKPDALTRQWSIYHKEGRSD